MDFDRADQIVTLPVLPLRGLVLFPDMMLHFDIGRKKSALAIDQAMRTNQTIFITAQRDVNIHDPKTADLYKVGTIARVIQVLKQPENVIRVVVEGICRAVVLRYEKESPFFTAQVEKIHKEPSAPSVTELALIRSAKSIFEQYVRLSPKMATDILYKVGMCNEPGALSDFITGNIILDYQNKQKVLETFDTKKRLEKLIEYITNEVFILEIEEKINHKARERIDEGQREYFLREQLRVIEEELGEDDDLMAEAEEYKEKVLALKLKEDVEKVLLKECSKLEKMPYGAQEANVIRNYLDLCLELPWNTSTKERIDIEKAKRCLDKNHYGLDKVKSHILELLAVRKLAPHVKGQILCLVGPPGVGKTSIAQSIAGAINRKSARIALGGVHDESEIRGHRRTYIGSMPGRIMNAVKISGMNNPVLILDEVDKLGNDYKGDPTSALLEVLDAEQNSTFHDHYIDLPFDLSNVFFITTANDKSMIPAPLLDRMDIIEVPSYTREEKFHIAKKHLLPKQMKNCGMNGNMFRITDSAVYDLIDSYTREAGVRNLERKITALLRKSAVKLVEHKAKRITVDQPDLVSYLGPRKFKTDLLGKTSEIGVANGLAWTSVGGETLPIEVAVVSGTGKIELTGSLGDVMKESAKTAVTCVRSHANRWGIEEDFYKKYDIHIHAPEGAVPKDGPSAGITMATALVSALTNIPVRSDVAMTGEVTLRGKVLPIGGLKEKSMAAYRLGVNTVIIPNENQPDLSEIDGTVKNALHFVPVNSLNEVLDCALVKLTKTELEKANKIIPAQKAINQVENRLPQ